MSYNIKVTHTAPTFKQFAEWGIQTAYPTFYITPFLVNIGTLYYLVFSSYLFIKSFACINKYLNSFRNVLMKLYF